MADDEYITIGSNFNPSQLRDGLYEHHDIPSYQNIGFHDSDSDYKIIIMSQKLQDYCRQNSLPIFNHTNTTNILIRTLYS